ncbi:MAG: type II secretion system F family protein [Lachnospiraceae bacterium]
MKKLHIEKSYWQQDIQKKEYIRAVLQGLILQGCIAYLFYQSYLMLLLLTPLQIAYLRSWNQACIRQKKEEFQLQFKESMQALSAALNVGYSMENALKETLKDLRLMYDSEKRIIQEFIYMIRQLNMNLTVEQVLQEFSIRVEQEDVQNFVTVFVMAKRSGGDMIGILRNAIRQICDKVEAKREIQTMMTAKKLEFRVMSMIPFGIIFYMQLSFPEFMEVLYGNTVGMIIMTGCLMLYLVAYWLGKRIIEIEV